MKKKEKRPEGAVTPSGHKKHDSKVTIKVPLIIKIGNSTVAEINEAEVSFKYLTDYSIKKVIKGEEVRGYIMVTNLDGVEVVING